MKTRSTMDAENKTQNTNESLNFCLISFLFTLFFSFTLVSVGWTQKPEVEDYSGSKQSLGDLPKSNIVKIYNSWLASKSEKAMMFWPDHLTTFGKWSGTGAGYSSFYGYYAGEKTTGYYNAFFGQYAGRNTTSGTRNSFFGYHSGNRNSTGYDNSFFGHNSGNNNLTGYNNSFFGSQSGHRNTTGRDNAFFGYQSGYTNTIGIDNTFIGNEAGQKNTSGNQNTFLGEKAGYYNTTASYNVFLGHRSGHYNTSSSYNTYVGVSAGHDANGSRNVFLGYQAGFNEAGSNKLYIDNSSTSTPLIYGDFSANQVGINVKPSAGFTMHVGGKFKANDRIVVDRKGIAGTYNSSQVQGIWSIGDGWKIDESKNDFGTQYGLVYAHTNSGQGISDWNHQIMFVNSGDMNSSISLTHGHAYFKGNVGVGTTAPSYKMHVNGDIFSSAGWMRVAGNRGLYFENWGGGFYMTDATWIRTYGSKNFYHNTGIMRTDGTFQVGPGGNRFIVNTSGNVGIGTTSPSKRLHVNGGTMRVETTNGHIDIGSTHSSWGHITTDRPKFYFNRGISVDEGIVSSYDEDLQLQTSGTTRMTLSNTDGNVTINNNLIVEGTLKLDTVGIRNDNSVDDLLTLQGDGSLGTRSVQSIESPWMWEEIFNGQDTLLMVCPDSAIIGNVFIDVIDLNGNLRVGENAYIDDDVNYGDDGTPDDWMKFNDHIEFRSSAPKHGIVLYDRSSLLHYTNIMHEAGRTFFSNSKGADDYFMRATGRDVEFGGNVSFGGLSGAGNFTLNSPTNLYFAIDSDNNSEGGENNAIVFGRNSESGTGANFDELLVINEDGNVGIGNGTNRVTVPAGYRFSVDGKIIVEEIKVELSTAWPDYVFNPSYELMPIQELKSYIRERKHLPNVPSAQEIKDNGGMELGDMNKKLMEKVEELTLYLIDEHDRINAIQEELEALKAENQELRNALAQGR